MEEEKMLTLEKFEEASEVLSELPWILTKKRT